MKKLLVLAATLAIGLVFSAPSMARSYPHVGGYKHVTQINRAENA